MPYEAWKMETDADWDNIVKKDSPPPQEIGDSDGDGDGDDEEDW